MITDLRSFLKVLCHTKFKLAEREAQCILGEYGPLNKQLMSLVPVGIFQSILIVSFGLVKSPVKSVLLSLDIYHFSVNNMFCFRIFS